MTPSKALVVVVAIICLLLAAAIFRSGHTLAAVLAVGLTATLVSPVSWLHHWVYLIPALIVLWFLGQTKTHIFVFVAALALVIQGTDVGESILQSGPSWLTPLGILLRESLLFASATTIAMFFALCRAAPRPAMSPAPQPLESAHR